MAVQRKVWAAKKVHFYTAPRIHYRFHKTTVQDPILNQFDTVIFINQLIHSIITVVDVKIYVI
jgi:hypothetical protein